MKNGALSRLMVAFRMALASIIDDYRHKTGLRRTAKRWLFVSVLLFLDNCAWVEFVEPTSLQDTAVALGVIAIGGLFWALVWSAVAAILRQSWAQAAVHDLRASGRYRGFGLQSLLVGGVLTGTCYMDLGLNFWTYVWLINETPYVLVHDIVYTLGPVLAMALGIVGMVRPSWAGRVLGALGTIAALNVWVMMHSMDSLWSRVGSAVTTLWEYYAGIPVSVAYDVAGGNPIVGCVIIVAVSGAAYALARRWVVRNGWRNLVAVMRV